MTERRCESAAVVFAVDEGSGGEDDYSADEDAEEQERMCQETGMVKQMHIIC